MTQETKQFDADVAQLIQLVTHSIYSNTDIFLRELISNANDACQKARIMSLQDTTYLGDETDLSIHIDVDVENKTLTITDTGIGMSREEVIEHIGTIAKSGTKTFMENLKKATKKKKEKAGESNDSTNDLIGQFGIGFYSAFMVAKKVVLETKAPGHDAVLWTSTGDGSYTIDASTKTTRGTTITLHLHDEQEHQAYADTFKIRQLIKQHSNYVPVAITMFKEEEGKNTTEKETINEMKSLRTRRKSDIKSSEYEEFYKSLTYNQDGPLDTIHIDIEGAINFKALLFIPKAPSMFESMMGGGGDDKDYGPSLYVQNVLIKDKAKELLPVWLRFVKGVVETPDISLNVSREILQSNTILAKIQKTLIKEILKSLSYIAKTDEAGYAGFYTNYSRYIKEGVYYEKDNKEEVASLLYYYSNTLKKEVSFDTYLINQYGEDALNHEEKDSSEEANAGTENTKHIYYLLGKSTHELEQSPYLEQFTANTTDVLLLADPLDEYIIQALPTYTGYTLTNASSPDVLLGDKKDIEKQKKETEKLTKDNKGFLESVMKLIGDTRLEKAEFTKKIGDNLAVLVTPTGQPSPQMERTLKAMGQTVPEVKRILQINPAHPLIANKLGEKNIDNNILQYMYEQAFLLEGGELEDVAGFLKRVNQLIQK